MITKVEAVVAPPESCQICGARRIGIVDSTVYFICGNTNRGTVEACRRDRKRFYISTTHTHIRSVVDVGLPDRALIAAMELKGMVEVTQETFDAYRRIYP